MERFAFKINKALKESLYKICRLCGIDNDLVDKVPILSDEIVVNVDGEPLLIKKIEDCVGFTITKDDKMPQKVCTICLDKINDFFEFREMCYATNEQTRKLLGLKSVETKKTVAEIKPEVDVKEECYSTSKRPRKRRADEPITRLKAEDKKDVKNEYTLPVTVSSTQVRKKLRMGENSTQKKQKNLPDNKFKPKVEISGDEPSQILVNALKLKHLCLICDQRFSNKLKLDRHLESDHVPNILRFMCTACNEVINKLNDIKNHQLWHKLSKTPYECGLCDEKCISIYAYSRHLRLHCCEISNHMLVLDRECPQCKETFVTNFLYNIHRCALRTKKCAGCNRLQRNESEYLKHSAICPKTYLTYSKHIPAAIAAETNVWIKNENDLEDASIETLARGSGISLDMTPVVSLTRISTPLLMSANQCVAIPHSETEYSQGDLLPSTTRATKKNNKKGVSKRDLKRVDDLLRSTLDALVSIKHEPEVHVDNDITSVNGPYTGESDDDFTNDDNDFHNNDSDNDISTPNNDENTFNNFLPIKAEKVDESLNDTNLDIVVKKEKIEYSDSVTPGEKMPVLKIKIKKEHGTLNSSLVDECPIEKKKKKKKRKDDKEREKTVDKNQNSRNITHIPITTNASAIDDPSARLSIPDLDSVHIKQEILDESEKTTEICSGDRTQYPEATIMTSIPLLQFQISCVSSGVEFKEDGQTQDDLNKAQLQNTQDINMQQELEDIKPNRSDLDRMLQIMSVSCGIQMPEDSEKSEETISKHISNLSNTESTQNNSEEDESIINSSKNTILGENANESAISEGTANELINKSPQQVNSIENTLPNQYVDFNTDIKPEPCNRGYIDEIQTDINIENNEMNEQHTHTLSVEMATYNSIHAEETSASQENHATLMQDKKETEEQAYIESIDFMNIQIKQERDIDISDEQINNADFPVNGVVVTKSKSAESENLKHSNIFLSSNCAHVDSNREIEQECDSTDDEEDSDYELSEEEDREYRELELPPPLLLDNQKIIHKEKADDTMCKNSDIIDTQEIVASTSTTCDQQLEQMPLLITNVYSNATGIMQNSCLTSDSNIDSNSKDSHNIVVNENQNLNIKISAISSGCKGFTFETATEIETTCAETLSIHGDIHEEKEEILEAQPYFESTATNQTQENISNANDDVSVNAITEEQQNLINHITDLSATSNMSFDTSMLAVDEMPSGSAVADNLNSATDTASSKLNDPSVTNLNNEETDNFINESTAAAARRHEEQQQQVSYNNISSSSNTSVNPMLLDNSNLNEIAENNNNANIERELQDDNIMEDLQNSAHHQDESSDLLNAEANDVT